MHYVNQFLAQTPYDLYELALFCLVVKHRSFTAAARVAGLTQSAVTRQIQGIETALGVPLLKRTTRSVSLTAAGEYLFREASRLVGDVESSLRVFRQEFANAPKEIRVSVSHSIGLAYLPGFFHANLRQLKDVAYRVQFQNSADILFALESDEQDVGVICPSSRLPRTLAVAHRFIDVFTLVAPESLASEYLALVPNRRRAWLAAQRWLLIDPETNTGARLQSWIKKNSLHLKGEFAVANFDLLINLVSLGMGLSFVPARALALYAHKKSIRRLSFGKPFTRQLLVLTKRRARPPAHLEAFIRNILF
jgi:DNA-binding transcriptional LysR family regulator